jgi:hypothetical protein
MNEAKSTQTESVLVCSLPAPDLAARRVEINKFFKGAKSVTGTPDGILFVFANTPDIAHALTDFILFEQKCCGTILYELRSSPPHTQLTLQLYAPQKQVWSTRFPCRSCSPVQRTIGQDLRSRRPVWSASLRDHLSRHAGRQRRFRAGWSRFLTK